MILTTLTVEGLILTIVGLIILWIIVSIPVWLAAKALTGGRATFGGALLATLAGPIVYVLVAGLTDLALGSIIGAGAFVFGYILALIAWIGVYKASFGTGWLRAIAIAFLAWVLFIVLSIIFGILFEITYPAPFFPKVI